MNAVSSWEGVVPVGAELWRACTEEDLVQGWEGVGIGPMERMGAVFQAGGKSEPRQGDRKALESGKKEVCGWIP